MLTWYETTDGPLPDLPVDLAFLDKLKQRVNLSRKIDQAEHKVKKQSHERSWIKEAAESMELVLGSEFELVTFSYDLDHITDISHLHPTENRQTREKSCSGVLRRLPRQESSRFPVSKASWQPCWQRL